MRRDASGSHEKRPWPSGMLRCPARLCQQSRHPHLLIARNPVNALLATSGNGTAAAAVNAVIVATAVIADHGTAANVATEVTAVNAATGIEANEPSVATGNGVTARGATVIEPNRATTAASPVGIASEVLNGENPVTTVARSGNGNATSARLSGRTVGTGANGTAENAATGVSAPTGAIVRGRGASATDPSAQANAPKGTATDRRDPNVPVNVKNLSDLETGLNVPETVNASVRTVRHGHPTTTGIISPE